MMVVGRLLLGSAVSLLIVNQALAGKWYVEPSASVRAGYDDNVRLVTSNEEGAFSTFLNVKVPFGFRTEVSDVSLSAQLNSRRYDGLSNLDTDDQILGLNAAYRSGRNQFGLQGSYKRNSTRTSELETTGLVQTSKRRTGISLSPSWSRALTERLSLQLGYHYNDVSYQDADLTNLVDYRYDKATVGMAYKLSERREFYSNLSASSYDALDAGTEIQTYGFQLGMRFKISESLSANTSASLTHTQSEYLATGGGKKRYEQDAFLVDLSLKKSYETLTVEGSLSASETPSSRGRILRKNAVGLSLRKELSQRTTLTLRGNVYENTSASGLDDDSDDRLYYSLEPGLSWRATRWWSIKAAYRFRRQDYTNTSNGAAESNAVFITASYIWPRE